MPRSVRVPWATELAPGAHCATHLEAPWATRVARPSMLLGPKSNYRISAGDSTVGHSAVFLPRLQISKELHSVSSATADQRTSKPCQHLDRRWMHAHASNAFRLSVLHASVFPSMFPRLFRLRSSFCTSCALPLQLTSRLCCTSLVTYPWFRTDVPRLRQLLN